MVEILLKFLAAFFKPFISLFFSPVILITIVIVCIVLFKRYRDYKTSSYYELTKLPYSIVKKDLGKLGEYYTYKHLRKLEDKGAKFLFNVYIPKDDGETTEIDVLMLCNKGIFVFESKNYSGWIFGSEGQKNWYQTLPRGRGQSHKEHFYNPIMQNRSHIKHLKAFVGEQVPMISIIVFSDRCTLKNIKIDSEDINVINRSSVFSVVSSILENALDDHLVSSDITSIYNKLYPFTQVDDSVKKQHIVSIHSKDTDKNTLHEVSAEEKVLETPSGVPETVNNGLMQAESDNSEKQQLKCPRCNGDLVLRTATRGANAGKQFYGCSNYPKCKYIKSDV